MKEPFNDKINETGDGILEVEGLRRGKYDTQAVKYDRLISNSLYNRIMWGNSPGDYAGFCKTGLESNKGGIIADLGCGTLGFTHKVYARYSNKNTQLSQAKYYADILLCFFVYCFSVPCCQAVVHKVCTYCPSRLARLRRVSYKKG